MAGTTATCPLRLALRSKVMLNKKSEQKALGSCMSKLPKPRFVHGLHGSTAFHITSPIPTMKKLLEIGSSSDACLPAPALPHSDMKHGSSARFSGCSNYRLSSMHWLEGHEHLVHGERSLQAASLLASKSRERSAAGHGQGGLIKRQVQAERGPRAGKTLHRRPPHFDSRL